MTSAAPARMPGITHREARQIERANASDAQPAIFIHGLWLLASSWDRWGEHFQRAGYSAVSVSWPGDPESVAEANARPEAFAGQKVRMVADHVADVIRALKRKPVVIGHSFGGLLAQITAGRGLSAATVAVDPAPFRGVLPLPLSALRSALPVLRDPRNWSRTVALTFDQFRYGWTNALSESEAKQLYSRYMVPAPGAPIFQAATANVNPWTQAQVDRLTPQRGPLLIISGEKDHTVPRAIAYASFKRQRRNAAPTEFEEIPGRGHSLTIDSGWHEVADRALAFVKRSV